MKKENKEILRRYFEAIDLDTLEPEFRSRLVRACVGFASSGWMEKIKAFYPMRFGNKRQNSINLMNPNELLNF